MQIFVTKCSLSDVGIGRYRAHGRRRMQVRRMDRQSADFGLSHRPQGLELGDEAIVGEEAARGDPGDLLQRGVAVDLA